MRSMTVWVVLGFVLAAGGCSLRRNEPLPQTYVLRAVSPQPAPVAAASAPSLRVARAQTAPGLDTDRIALLRGDRRLDYFASSRWPAALSDLIESLTAETLRNTGVWSQVSDSGGGFPADFMLQIQVRRFEADYTQGDVPMVHVLLDCSFGRRPDRELLASFVAEAKVRASANRMAAVVAAFEQATNETLGEVAKRSAEAVAVTSKGR